MIAQFALRLICGMSLMWALMPRRQVTSGFFRIQMLVVMGLGTLAALATVMQAQSEGVIARQIASGLVVHWFDSPYIAGAPAALIALLGFIGSALWTLERRSGAERIGFGVLCLSAILIVVTYLHLGWDVYFSDEVINFAPDAKDSISPSFRFIFLTVVSEFTGAAVVGAAVVGMLLGHWYLTTPTMSIEPLQRLNWFLGIAGSIRLLASATLLALLWNGSLDPVDADSQIQAIPKVWLGLRWLAGVIGPIGVSLMVWRILKYRNTQAATGVLFVGVILAFIGDMTAALLLLETKLPL